MTIDATKPLATDLVSAIDDYIREDRAQINALWAALVAANCTETDHEMGAGEFALEIGTDLEDVILELVNLTGAAALNLMQITDGSGGMIKVIKAGDNNITVKHNASYIYLSGESDFNLSTGDVLVLINSGGDPDSSINGVWYEVARSTGSVVWANTYTAHNMSVGDTSLDVGDDLANVGTETVGLTADGAVNLTYITDGRAGMIKYILALDNNITLVQNEASTTNGTFFMNAPAGVDLAMNTGDIVAFVNVGGNGSTVDGYWRELFRTLHV